MSCVSYLTELHTSSTEVVDSARVEVTTANNVATINTSTSKVAEVIPNNYTLSSGGLYSGYLNGNAPQWIADIIDVAISDYLSTNYDTILDTYETQIGNLELGVSQNIVSIQNSEQSLNALITSVKSELDGNIAGVSDVVATKVDAASAEALVRTLVGSNWLAENGTIAESYIEGIATTKVSEGFAENVLYNQLVSAVNDSDTGLTGLATAKDLIFTKTGMDPVTGALGATSGYFQELYAEVGDNAASITTIEQVNVSQGSAISALDTSLTGLIDITIPSLQSQIDGVIDTWFYDGEPTLVNAPASTWMDDTVKASHVGDLYYDKLTGYGYRFAYEDIEDTPDMGVIFTWIRISDVDVVLALSNAAAAKDTADGKRAIYTGSTIPTGSIAAPLSTGDMWIPSADVSTYVKGEIYLYVEGANPVWVLSTNYTAAIAAVQQEVVDWIAGDYATFVADIQGQVDGKAESYYVETMPHPEGTSTTYAVWVGDLWKQPSTNDEYVYVLDTGVYKWLKTDVPDIVYDTIDTKKSIYTGNAVPNIVAPDVLQTNDMWITGDSPVTPYVAKSIYVWTGTAWEIPVKYTDDGAVVTLSNGLVNGTVNIDLTSATVDGTTSITDYVATEIDKEVVVYSGTDHTTQVGMKLNDIYIEKTVDNSGAVPVDVVNTWKYDGVAWISIGSNSNLTALADLADGKRTIYANQSHDIPVGEVNDIWIPTTGTNDVTYVPKEVYQYNGASWVIATRYSADISALSDNIQEQIDLKVDTYYQATVPTGMTEVNNGDYWYCTANVSTYVKGKVYKYVHATTSWVETADVSKYVFDIADGKSTIFTTAALPAKYNARDMLVVVGSNFNNGTSVFTPGVVLISSAARVSGFVASDWTKQINDTEDLDAFVSAITPEVDLLRVQIDHKIEYYFQLSAALYPSTAWTTQALKDAHHGDVLFHTDTQKAYRYYAYDNTWVEDQSLVAALSKAALAQETADGKATVYYGTSAPTLTASDVGDMFVNSTTGVTQVWNGSGWVNVTTVATNEALAKLADLEEARDGVIDTFYVTTAPPSGMSYGDYWVDIDSWTGTAYVVYRYEALDGSSTGTLAWRVNTGETAVALGKAYRADVAGSAATAAQTTATNAQNTANTASSNATAALNKLTDIASDNILSPVEKSAVILEYSVITTERAGILAQATTFGVTTERTTYDNAVTALINYLATLTTPVLWNVTTGDTTIVGTAFRTNFSSVYTSRQLLLDKIATNAKALTDAAATTATWLSVASRPTSLATLNATDGTTLSNATTAISDIANDNVFSAVEKSGVRREWTTIVNEKAAIEAQATGLSITTENTAYVNSIVALGTYFNAGTAWVFSTSVVPSWIADANLGVNTAIVGATFRTNFNAYYIARQALMTKISAVINSTATTAQTAANTANTNATSALNKITDMASDNILSPVEKPSIITEYNVIIAEQAGIDSQATAYGITTEKTTYDTAVSALTTYLGTLTSPVAWNTLTGDTTIVGTTFRSKFSGMYTARQAVLNAITAKAKLLADTAQGTADGKVKTWYQTSAPTGLTTADIGDIWVDTDAGNVTKTWSGSAWVDITNTKTNTAYTWSAEASKLITSPDGNVTGWSFGDGSNVASNFRIQADKFQVSNSTTGLTPFSISGTDVLFNGKVSFTNVTGTSDVALVSNLPTYTSGTVNPTTTTEPIQSVYLNTTDSSLWTYTSAGWVPGGDPDAITQATLNTALADNTTVIDGGRITTGIIDAGRIFTDEIIMQTAYSGVIKSANYVDGVSGMKVDFKNGSIYIA